jgi:hypothetical protein
MPDTLRRTAIVLLTTLTLGLLLAPLTACDRSDEPTGASATSAASDTAARPASDDELGATATVTISGGVPTTAPDATAPNATPDAAASATADEASAVETVRLFLAALDAEADAHAVHDTAAFLAARQRTLTLTDGPRILARKDPRQQGSDEEIITGVLANWRVVTAYYRDGYDFADATVTAPERPGGPVVALVPAAAGDDRAVLRAECIPAPANGPAPHWRIGRVEFISPAAAAALTASPPAPPAP